MTTYVPAPAVPLRVNEPLTLSTELSPVQVIVASPIVGVTPPVCDMSPLFGRLSSPPGAPAETVAGATSAAPTSPATASQPAVRNFRLSMCAPTPLPKMGGWACPPVVRGACPAMYGVRSATFSVGSPPPDRPGRCRQRYCPVCGLHPTLRGHRTETNVGG